MKPSFLVFQNGKRIAGDVLWETLAVVPAQTDRHPPEIFDFGFFESMKTMNRKIIFEMEHLERLLQSARTAGSGRDWNMEKIRREVRNALESFYRECGGNKREPAFVRLSVWGRCFFVMIGYRRHNEALYRNGVKLQTSPVLRTHPNASPAEVKTSAYLNSVMAFMEPLAPEVYERILLDTNGYVTESCVGNLFAVKEGILRTPETYGILNGVTRRFVIKCAHQAGIKTAEMPLTRHDFFNADEVFLTNTSWEILPVAELDGRVIGARIPGPVTATLQRIFKTCAKERYL